MSMSANLHHVTSMEADGVDDVAWLKIRAKNGDAIAVFMPRKQAEMIAEAFDEYDREPEPRTYDDALGTKLDREATLDRDLRAAGRV